jgi:hypothetical protein
MSLGQAFDDADELLTLIALLPIMLGLLVFTSNINNPNFNGIAAFERLITDFAHALVPSIGAIMILGLIIFALRNAP